MVGILVQPPWSRDPSTVLAVGPGERLTFGRGVPGVPVDLALSHPGVPRMAGEVAADDRYWHLSNWSQTSTYLVENPEGAGEHFKVGPGWQGMPVPFEIARVVLPVADETLAFQVFAPAQPQRAWGAETAAHSPDGSADSPLPGTATSAPFPMDETAKYFLVLVALCEPRLRGDILTPLPTVSQVVERLRDLPGCAALTNRAVDFHIDYLARIKLRLKVKAVVGSSGRRHALAEFALRFGLVREDHLPMLPGTLASARSRLRRPD